MNEQNPAIYHNMQVYAAYNIRETIKARHLCEISMEELILAPMIIFARTYETADYILRTTGFHPECEVIFYLHLPGANNYRPLIRAVTKDNKSFPYYFNN